MTSFKQLKLIDPLLRAVAQENYQQPTPIQAQSIPLLLAGRDILGCAQTGTGKTAAFALPMLQMLTQSNAAQGKPVIRALVLSPTRELAAQIEESFQAYARYLKLRHLVIFGGVKQNPQVTALRQGVHILVATDLASRGIDVENISHVFNFDLPHEPEVYIHRIGRTGRAGLSGVAISFCDASETADLRSIERLIGNEIPVDTNHAWHSPNAMTAAPALAPARQKPQSRRRGKPGRPRSRTGPGPKPTPAPEPGRKAGKPARESRKKPAGTRPQTSRTAVNRRRRRWRHSSRNQRSK